MLARLASVIASVDLSAWLPVLGDAALKSTVILAVAALLAAALRRSSAALRHLVWTVAVASVVLLPVLSRVLPAWNAPLVPTLKLTLDVSSAAASNSASAANGELAIGSFEHAGVSRQPSTSDSPLPTPSANRTGHATTPPDAVAAPVADAPHALATDGAPTMAASSAPSSFGWRRALALVWLAGATVVLLRLALGTLAVWRIARGATRVTDASWLALAQRTAKELGLLRPVTLLVGESHGVPLTWGIVYPVVLLPPSAAEWSEERRRLVLVHELSHVDRLDALTQVVAQIGLALFWFNPLFWLAVSRMRAERERACDDRVIAAGTRASRYADDLLTIVRSLERRAAAGPAFAALAMARRSEFEGRLLAILDPSVPRARVGRRRAAAVAASALALVLPLSALRPWRAEAAESRPAAAAAPKPASLFSTLDTAAAKAPLGPSMVGTLALARMGAAPLTSALGDLAAGTPTPDRPTSALRPAAPVVTTAVGYATGGSRECRRTTYTGPGYNFHVGSGRHTSMNVINDDRGTRVATMLIVNDTLCMLVDVAGSVTFNADRTDLASVSPDGHVHVERSRDGREEQLDVTPDGHGGLTRRYFANGQESDPAGARALLAELIPYFVRETAIDPNGEVARIRRASGIAGVLREISLISSDGAKRKYFDALITSGSIPADTLRLLAQLAARTISSDGDKAAVLQRVDEQAGATPAVHAAVADAARTISSDGDKRRVLESAVSRGGTAVPAYAVATIAGDISSDGDKAAVLRHVAERYDGSDSLRKAYFGAANTISSDGDRSRVLLDLVARPRPLDQATMVALLRSAREISSDGDKSSVLLAVVRDSGLTDAASVRSAFFDAANTITGDNDRANVLLAIVRRGALSPAAVADVLESARGISSDHDKANVLEAIARSVSLADPATRARFVAVLKTVSSDNDYRRVMDQLVK